MKIKVATIVNILGILGIYLILDHLGVFITSWEYWAIFLLIIVLDVSSKFEVRK